MAPIKHVLIVGGGLAGPCLALSLARHNISSTIFEIRATRSEAGGSISLGPNALHVLDKYAGVYEQIKAAGFIYRRMGAYDDAGNKIGEIAVGLSDEGYPAVRIMRTTLNRVLLDAAEATGLVGIKWGARLEKIEEDAECVTAFLEDGTQVQGDILIGADGLHSKVREHVLPGKAPDPVYSGIIIVNGFLPASLADKPTPDFSFPAVSFSAHGIFMCIPFDPEGENLAWALNTSMSERDRKGWKELEESGEAARLAKADYDDATLEPVRSVLDNADNTKVKLWPTYSIPDLPTWHTARVCLIGDAAHALPPNGMGSTVAFEDAAILTRLLTSQADVGNHEALFAKLESVRRPRIDALKKDGSGPSALKAKSGALTWFLKKWAVRAFFWKSGGVLRHSKEPDDAVDHVDLNLSL